MKNVNWTSVVLVAVVLAAGCTCVALDVKDVGMALLGAALGLVVPAPLPFPKTPTEEPKA